MVRRFWVTHRELGRVAGDEAYGVDPELRDWLEEHRIGYVLAVKKDTPVPTAVAASTSSPGRSPPGPGRHVPARMVRKDPGCTTGRWSTRSTAPAWTTGPSRS
ncbi:hypothetical protein [Frankia sp. QA3]